MRTFSGRRLRELRTAAGFSRQSLADHIGRSCSVVVDYEHGRVRPSIHALTQLSAVLRCPIDELFAEPRTPATVGFRTGSDL